MDKMSKQQQRYRTALEQIAALEHVTEVRGPLEHWFTPDHLVDTEGWGPIKPEVKQGLTIAAHIAKKALSPIKEED